MKESFLDGYTMGEKIGRTIRYKGIIGVIWHREPDETTQISKNAFINASNLLGYYIGFLRTGMDALFFPEFVVSDEVLKKAQETQRL